MSIIDEDWSMCTNFQEIENQNFLEYQQKIQEISPTLISSLEKAFKIPRFVGNGLINLKDDDQLETLIEKNKQLRLDIETKLSDLGRQQSKYVAYKKDQQLLSQEIKETHEAFLMAKKYYKKFLKIYYSVESKNNDEQKIFIQFFTEVRRESEKYSVSLLRHLKSGQYDLLKTTPKLSIHNELELRLKETNDVPGVLCCIRQAFIALKENKKNKNIN